VSVSIDRALATLQAAQELSSLMRELIGLNDRLVALRLSRRKRGLRKRVRRKARWPGSFDASVNRTSSRLAPIRL